MRCFAVSYLINAVPTLYNHFAEHLPEQSYRLEPRLRQLL
jgi:hypothetical protein